MGFGEDSQQEEELEPVAASWIEAKSRASKQVRHSILPDEEGLLYSDDQIRVTSESVQLGSRTIPIQDIMSVELRVNKSGEMSWSNVAGVVVLLALMTLGPGNSRQALVYGGIGVALWIVGTLVWGKRSREYTLDLQTGDDEVESLTSKDADYTANLAMLINDAIDRRK